MNQFRTIFLFSLFGGFLFSCGPSSNYLNDPSISKEDGTPIDSLTEYFPTDSAYSARRDMPDFVSLSLRAMNEPVLRNYYLGHDIYRFTCIRSFHPPILFSLYRDNEQVWITTKELSADPMAFIPRDEITFEPPTNQKAGQKSPTEDPIPEQEVSKEETAVRLTLNERKDLTIHDWEEFERLVEKTGFWKMNREDDRRGLDGAHWLIEGHLKTGYTVVHRWSPNDSLRLIGEYLIKKSGRDLMYY